MEIRYGYGTTGTRVAGPVRVGDPLTLIIYMRSKYGIYSGTHFRFAPLRKAGGLLNRVALRNICRVLPPRDNGTRTALVMPHGCVFPSRI